MRPPRSQSPQHGHHFVRNNSLRQRPDQNADDIIRFVRDFQCDRQPTLLRLQKKAPLPGIGKTKVPGCSKNASSDSGFLDRGCESAESDDDIPLDNEISYMSKGVNPRLDPFVRDLISVPRGHAGVSNTDYLVLSRSLPNNNFDPNSDGSPTNRLTPPSRQNSFVRPKHKHSKRNSKCHPGSNASSHGNATLKQQLPPLERDDVPDRPTAPSPSRTPPTTSAYHDFIEEEPVDYIDLA